MPTNLPVDFPEAPQASRVRSIDQERLCEIGSMWITGLLSIPLLVVAWYLFDRGDTMYGWLAVETLVGFVILGLVRLRTVIPQPLTQESRPQSDQPAFPPA